MTFDRSLLPPARLELVVVADTHVMPDPGPERQEFESRRHQTARAEQALRLIAALEPACVVHLGDLVQIPIESPAFGAVAAAAEAQLRRHGLRPRHVAGNQDVGDKPDPTMPTVPVTAAALAAFHERFGPSWQSWDAGELHCVTVNTQIMNTGSPEEVAQRAWLEADLAANDGRRVCLFQHLPLYLFDEHEPDLGHYDNLGQPARAWLIDLARRHRIELIFSGHSHWSFFDRIASTRYFVTPSTSFTRPGFSEAFSSAPPAEQGRDDVAKLGFFLVRLQEDGGLRVHLVRTNGEEAGDGEGRLLTRRSADLPGSPLGLTLRHLLAPTGSVPIAWPSVVRQPVRNDYPFLSSLELGARHLRVPASDLDDPLQRRRLALLREEGVAVTASCLWTDAGAPAVERWRGLIDGVELRRTGALAPSSAGLAAIARHRDALGVPVTLSPIVAREQVAGKQLPRARLGYHLAELPALDAALGASGARVDRVLCTVPSDARPWEVMLAARSRTPLTAIGAVDWLVELTGRDDRAQAARAAEALFAGALLDDARVYLEPLIDLDRTMDSMHGLLDRACNPRSAYQVVRCLNTILFAAPEPRQPEESHAVRGGRALASRCVRHVDWLLVSDGTLEPTVTLPSGETAIAYRLVSGTSERVGAGRFRAPDEPTLIRAPAASAIG
jgi:3',5'-cyclic AMP phosphodiesterase CpdA